VFDTGIQPKLKWTGSGNRDGT